MTVLSGSVVRGKTGSGVLGDLVDGQALPKSSAWHDPSNDSKITLSNTAGGAGSWVAVGDVNALEGSYHRSNAANDTLTLVYTGGLIIVRVLTGPNAGQVKVAIDGNVYATALDLYSGSAAYKLVVFGTNLQAGTSHTLVLTVLGTKNPNSNNTYVNVDALLTDSGSGVTQIVSLASDTQTTASVASAAAATAVLLEADGATITGFTPGTKVGGVAVTANTNFLTVTESLSVTMDVEILIQILCSSGGASSLNLLRDGVSITTFSPSANTWGQFKFKDAAVAAGGHTYTLQLNANQNAYANMLVFDQLADEQDGSASGSTNITQTAGVSTTITVNGGSGSVSASVTMTMNAKGTVYIMAIAYYELNSAASYSWALIRDSTTLASGTANTNDKITYQDQAVPSGSHTYKIQITVSAGAGGFTVDGGAAIMVVSNGG